MAAINRPLPQARHGIPLPLGSGRINGWVLAGFAAFAIGALLPVLQNSAATSRGFDVQRMEAQQATLAGDIRILESEVAALTSLDRIERRAVELGLRPGTEPVYITIGEPGPEPPRISSEYLPRPEPIEVASEPWWQSLSSWLIPGL